AEPTGGGEGGSPVSAGDVEDGLASADIHRLAERLPDDGEGGADDGVVPAGPCGLLAGFDGSEIRNLGAGLGDGGGGHERISWVKGCCCNELDVFPAEGPLDSHS